MWCARTFADDPPASLVSLSPGRWRHEVLRSGLEAVAGDDRDTKGEREDRSRRSLAWSLWEGDLEAGAAAELVSLCVAETIRAAEALRILLGKAAALVSGESDGEGNVGQLNEPGLAGEAGVDFGAVPPVVSRDAESGDDSDPAENAERARLRRHSAAALSAAGRLLDLLFERRTRAGVGFSDRHLRACCVDVCERVQVIVRAQTVREDELMLSRRLTDEEKEFSDRMSSGDALRIENTWIYLCPHCEATITTLVSQVFLLFPSYCSPPRTAVRQRT
jgi:hypothetical protein